MLYQLATDEDASLCFVLLILNTYIRIIVLEMFKFAHKNFIDQFWIQNQQLRLTIRKYANKWSFTSKITTDRTNNSDFVHLQNLTRSVSVHYSPINLFLVINEILQVNRRFSESANERPRNWSDDISITPIIKMPR